MQDSHYQNHPKAAELHDVGGHAHEVGELHGKEDHLTAHERSRQAAEHHSHQATVGHGIIAFGHDEIAALAHEIWLSKGSPEGTAEQDWYEAVKKLRARSL